MDWGALGMGLGMLFGIAVVLLVWWAPGILIFCTRQLPANVRVPWGVASIAAMLFIPLLVAIVEKLVPKFLRPLTLDGLLLMSPVTYASPWLVYWLFRRRYRSILSPGEGVPDGTSPQSPRPVSAAPMRDFGIAIDGSSVEAFRASFAAMQAELDVAQRAQLRDKLQLLHAARMGEQGAAPGYSAEALRARLHGLTFAAILALDVGAKT